MNHAEEIAAIAAESAARVKDRNLTGRALLAERRACSAAIAAACARHREQMNQAAEAADTEGVSL